MTEEKNNTPVTQGDIWEQQELDQYKELSERHIQIKILKATQRAAKNLAFFFWVSIISAILTLLIAMAGGSAY